MAVNKDSVYLQHILLAITKIEGYVNRGGKELFDQDTAIQDALIKQIEIVGEAGKKISPEFRQKYPTIPWRKMTGMRDKLVHDYMGIDLEAVWKTAVTDIPTLKSKITPVSETVSLPSK